jgi:hypothetical protein
VDATQPAADSPDGVKPSGEATAAPAQNAVKAASGKPSIKGVPGKTVPGKTATGTTAAGKAAQNKSASSKSGTRSTSNNSAKAKTAAAKAKAAQDKKRAQSKAVALNLNRQKPSPATRPPAAESQ